MFVYIGSPSKSSVYLYGSVLVVAEFLLVDYYI